MFYVKVIFNLINMNFYTKVTTFKQDHINQQDKTKK